jgi:DNA invertase Pin-like site-specific DNA recombinase
MKFLSLIRVSTQIQYKKGSSLDEQKRVNAEYAKKNNGEIVAEVKIQVSGKDMVLNKGQLHHAIRSAKELNAEVIVKSLDRISRDQITLLTLKQASAESGVEIHLASMNRKISEISEAEFSMMALWSQMERRSIQQRIKESCKNRIGPIGQTLDPKKLAQKSVEARQENARQWAESINLLDQIKEAKDALKKPSIKNVAKYLNGMESRTRRGKKWTFDTLQNQVARLGWQWKQIA